MKHAYLARIHQGPEDMLESRPEDDAEPFDYDAETEESDQWEYEV